MNGNTKSARRSSTFGMFYKLFFSSSRCSDSGCKIVKRRDSFRKRLEIRFHNWVQILKFIRNCTDERRSHWENRNFKQHVCGTIQHVLDFSNEIFSQWSLNSSSQLSEILCCLVRDILTRVPREHMKIRTTQCILEHVNAFSWRYISRNLNADSDQRNS